MHGQQNIKKCIIAVNYIYLLCSYVGLSSVNLVKTLLSAVGYISLQRSYLKQSSM